MQQYEMQQQQGSRDSSDDVPVGGFYRCIFALSFVQLFCGIAALALGIANAIICGLFGSIGYGIWGSLIYFATGAYGIIAFVKQTRCAVGTHMILSIVAACTAAVQLGFGVGAAVNDYAALRASRKYGGNELDISLWNYQNGLDYFTIFGCSEKQRHTYWTWQASGPTVTDSLLASFACISGIIAILTAVYSCRICVCPPGVALLAGHTTDSKMTIVSKA
jgi:hypothetical protein